MANPAPPISRAAPTRPPGRWTSGAAWMRDNLFNTWYNSLLTLLSGWILYAAASSMLGWAFTSAEWLVVRRNLTLLMVGTFPRAQIWRVWAALLMVALLTGVSWALWRRARARRVLVGAWLLSLPVVTLVLHGLPGNPLLPLIGTSAWTGLLLTVLLAVVGIVVSFPFGVGLALGRVSTLPIVRIFSILYIEVIRGVPLISVLFFAQVMLPLFMPEGVRLDRVLRAMAGIVLFSAAYVAENVRGGLQSIPRGQVEAARAMGLNGAQVTGLIVLPQALRTVIPAMVGQFITLFKDTTLVSIVGLLELLGISQSVLANPQYLGKYTEVYLFVGLIFWVISFSMSYASRRLEKRLGVGER